MATRLAHKREGEKMDENDIMQTCVVCGQSYIWDETDEYGACPACADYGLGQGYSQVGTLQGRIADLMMELAHANQKRREAEDEFAFVSNGIMNCNGSPSLVVEYHFEQIRELHSALKQMIEGHCYWRVVHIGERVNEAVVHLSDSQLQEYRDLIASGEPE